MNINMFYIFFFFPPRTNGYFRSSTKLSRRLYLNATWLVSVTELARTGWYRQASSKNMKYSSSTATFLLMTACTTCVTLRSPHISHLFPRQSSSPALQDREDGLGRSSSAGHSTGKLHLRVRDARPGT